MVEELIEIITSSQRNCGSNAKEKLGKVTERPKVSEEMIVASCKIVVLK